MRLTEPHATAFRERRRYLAGPTGCGLCGIESLNEAMRAPAPISDDAASCAEGNHGGIEGVAWPASDQSDDARCSRRCVLAPGRGSIAVREDVGRHNAIDKLAGALARGKASSGARRRRVC